MRQDHAPAPGRRAGTERPQWSSVLLAIREAGSVTQDGWAARLGVSRRTVQRWERGESPPDGGAEDGILAYCRAKDLFRLFDRGPLAGLELSATSLHALLTEARTLVGYRPPARDERGETAITPCPVAPPWSLPAPLTSFVGRERELAGVRRLQAGTRLLTLTGTGGCGKTRLALELANELLWAYPNGVWLVELAALADPALVPQTVASALAVRTAGQQSPTGALVDALAARHLLLILDNCEHLLACCAPLVETLLRACPGLEVLATSREPLGIIGETIRHVPPMAVPSSEFLVPSEDAIHSDLRSRISELEQADSVRLFVERARLYQPDFNLTAATARHVAEICRRLDGMPLAIELAAARVTVLSADQIAARLGDRFHLLTGGGRTALPRHQTLRAAMDWSHDLLAPPERSLLRRLSVFAGGFTLEQVEAVCVGVGADGDDGSVAVEDVLDLIARLVDQSLVIAEERRGVVRYRMLETVRQYAAERLTAAGEAPATRERHAVWCLALAAAAESHRTGPEQDTWLAWLTIEHDNIRAALGWCLSDEHGVPVGLRLGGVLWWFWQVHGHFNEGRRWLAALLARGGDAPADARAVALNGAGALALDQGDHDEATRLHEQCLALRREFGDDAGVAGSLNNLGVAAGAGGDPTGARALFEESLALRRTLGDPWPIAQSLVNLGIVTRQQGEPERAVALYEEALASMRELGDTRSVATLLQNLGNAHWDQGAPERAAVRYREGLSLYQELQDRLGAARCLEGMAGVAATQGDAERAARQGGAAAAMREAIAVPLPPAGRAGLDQTIATARAAMGEAAFAAAWAAGRALSLEEATAEALPAVLPA